VGSIPSWPVCCRREFSALKARLAVKKDYFDMFFGIYKRGQGKNTRLWSSLGSALIVALGCYRLYDWLQAAEFGLNPRTGLWVATMVPVFLFVVLGLLVFRLVNKPSIADFMIAAEGEMKKVSWSSRKEIAVSTFIVILVVFVLAVLLGVTDISFQLLFGWILG
jgi:preprotein translocase subunit SecE